jgi:archaellum biogenesis ATPase FlaH
LCSSQKIKYYKNGYEGIQFIGEVKDSTIIYSHSMAKPTTEKEVGNFICRLYLKSIISSGKLVICTSNAEVFGNLKITRKGKLVLLLFTYTKVIWNDGTIEIPEKFKINLK